MARVAGASLDDCAARFNVRRDSVARHMARHVPAEIKAQYIADEPIDRLVERAAREGGSLLDYLTATRTLVMQQLQIAGATNSAKGVAALASRMVDILEAMGRLTGELLRSAPSTTTNINNTVLVQSPAFNSLQRMLLERLAPFPDARAAVIEGLFDLEKGGSPAPMITLPASEVAHAA